MKTDDFAQQERKVVKNIFLRWDGAKKVLSVEMTGENSARIFRLKS